MPILPGATPNINSALVGTGNAYDLVQLVGQRVPGYQLVEYLREVNEGYQELWRETNILDNDYFTAIASVTVAQQAQTFDLRYNVDANLSSAVHPKLYQPIRIRVLPVNSLDWVRTEPSAFISDPEMSQEQNSTQPASTTGPFNWQIFGRGILRFARPLPVGTTIEIIFSIGFFELNVIGNGTIQSTGAVVTGTSTTFTQLLGPDFLSYLPTLGTLATKQQLYVEAELIINPSTAPQSYKVNYITDDTHLNLVTTPATNIAASTPFVLATIPDIPESHRRLAATLATRNMLASPAIVQDGRFQYWDAKSERDLDRYRDSVTERQQQAVQRRQRFPLSMTRRGWSTSVQ